MRLCVFAILGLLASVSQAWSLDAVLTERCASLLSTAEITATEYSKLDEFYDQRLSQRRPTEPRMAVNSSNTMKRAEAMYDLPLGANGEILRVFTFGYPYRKNGKWLIDYQVVFDPGADKFFKKEKGLQTAEVDAFRQMAFEQFRRERLAEGKLVLLPSQRRGVRKSTVFDAYRVESASGSKVRVRAVDGTKKFVTADELFFHNAFIKTGNIDEFDIFYKAGGAGEIFRFQKTGGASEDGHYLVIRKLPRPEGNEALVSIRPLYSKETLAALSAVQAKGIRIYLTTDDLGIAAGHFPEGNIFTISANSRVHRGREKESSIAITYDLRPRTIAHELQHRDDSAQIDQMSREVLTPIFGSNALERADLFKILQYLKEQRAYATEVTQVTEPLSGWDTGVDGVVAKFQQHYEIPMIEIIAKLRAEDPARVAQLMAALRKHTLPSEALSVERLLQP